MKQLPSQSNTWISSPPLLSIQSKPPHNSLHTTPSPNQETQKSTMLSWIYPSLYTCFRNQKNPSWILIPINSKQMKSPMRSGREKKRRERREEACIFYLVFGFRNLSLSKQSEYTLPLFASWGPVAAKQLALTFQPPWEWTKGKILKEGKRGRGAQEQEEELITHASFLMSSI